MGDLLRWAAGWSHRDDPAYLSGVQQDFPIALVHVEVAATVESDGADQCRALANLRNVHVALSWLFQVGLGFDALFVVGTSETLAL